MGFSHNLGPKFFENIHAYILERDERHALRDGSESLTVAGMTKIAHGGRRRRSEPLRVVEHRSAVIVMRDEDMRSGVEYAFFEPAFSNPIITRILGEENRICEIDEESP